MGSCWFILIKSASPRWAEKILLSKDRPAPLRFSWHRMRVPVCCFNGHAELFCMFQPIKFKSPTRNISVDLFPMQTTCSRFVSRLTACHCFQFYTSIMCMIPHRRNHMSTVYNFSASWYRYQRQPQKSNIGGGWSWGGDPLVNHTVVTP